MAHGAQARCDGAGVGARPRRLFPDVRQDVPDYGQRFGPGREAEVQDSEGVVEVGVLGYLREVRRLLFLVLRRSLRSLRCALRSLRRSLRRVFLRAGGSPGLYSADCFG